MITIIWLLGNPKHDSDLLLRSEGKWMSKVCASLNTLIVTEKHSDSALFHISHHTSGDKNQWPTCIIGSRDTAGGQGPQNHH